MPNLLFAEYTLIGDVELLVNASFTLPEPEFEVGRILVTAARDQVNPEPVVALVGV